MVRLDLKVRLITVDSIYGLPRNLTPAIGISVGRKSARRYISVESLWG